MYNNWSELQRIFVVFFMKFLLSNIKVNFALAFLIAKKASVCALAHN